MLEALLNFLLLSICKCKARESCWELCTKGQDVFISRLFGLRLLSVSVGFSPDLLSSLLIGGRGAKTYA